MPKLSTGKYLAGSPVPKLRLTATQQRNRTANMDALRDIRVLGAIWHAGLGELNDNGKEVMRNLHSPIATIQHMWCSDAWGPRLRALVDAFLKESAS